MPALPAGADPADLTIYNDSVIILFNRAGKYALYSVQDMRFATTYAYDEILLSTRTARWRASAPTGAC